MNIKKINVLIVVILMLVTSLVIVPEDIKVKASGGSGDIELDYDFIYNVTQNLSNIIFDVYGEDNGIAKGRVFGTSGEHHAAGLIADWMENLSLFDPTTETYPTESYFEKFEDIWYLGKNTAWGGESLTGKIEVLDLNFTVNSSNYGLYYPDCFIKVVTNGSRSHGLFYNRDLLTNNFSSSNLEIKLKSSVNISSFINAIIYGVIANFSFDNSSDILYDIVKDYFEEYYNFTFDGIDPQDNSTWPDFVNKYCITSNFTTFGVTEEFNPDFFTDYSNDIKFHPFLTFCYNIVNSLIDKVWCKCYNTYLKGNICYDYTNYAYNTDVNGDRDVPTIFINGTIGNNLSEDYLNCTIDFYINQNYNDSVNSYNVIGQINGTQDKTVILSSLYDSLWTQGTADSAIGVGIVLAIAKYMKNLSDMGIQPKYNVKFITFGGEEYGYVGARYYSREHLDEHIKAVIDLNQLGFSQPDTENDPPLYLNIITNKIIEKEKMEKISDIFNYESRINNVYGLDHYYTPIGSVSNDLPFATNRPLCKTVLFLKDFGWYLHHRDGMNHSKGDIIDHYDSDDVNLTAQLVWNVTKYYTINPNCWFKPDSISVQTIDSGGDSNSIPDEVQVSFTINTIMPKDRVTVRAFLRHIGEPKYCFFRTPVLKENTDTHYIVENGQDTNDQINIKLPDCAPEGEYSLHLYLYNSTGEIKDHVYNPHSGLFLNSFYANQTEFITINDEMQGVIDTPSTPTNLNGPSESNAGTIEAFSYKASYPTGGKISFQNDWGNSANPVYENQNGLYNSLETCNTEYMWTSDGNINFRVRARDEALSPNVWSDWSSNLDITVNPGCNNIGTEQMVLDNSYQIQCYDFGFTGVNWTVNFSYYDEALGMQNYTYYTSSPTHEYDNISDIGQKTTYLKVNDSSYNWYYFNRTIDVVNVSAFYNVTLDGFAQPGVNLNFTNHSEVSDAFHIDSLSWDFDDGNTSNQTNPSHNYSTAGNYNVTLNVTINNSEYSTYSRIIYVDNTISTIIPGISISHDDIAPGNSLTFYSYLIETGSSVDDIYVNITNPEGAYSNYSMNDDTSDPFSYEHSFNDTTDLGWYNVTFWTKDKAGNSNKSVNSFYISSILGYKTDGVLNSSVENNITGSKFKLYHYSEAENITAYVYGSESNPAEYQCMIYENLELIAKTENKTVNQTGWTTFNISGTKPILDKDTFYYLTIWGNNSNAKAFYNNASAGSGMWYDETYDAASPPTYLTAGNREFTNRSYSIYCNYTPDTIPPEITSVSDSPDPTGLGCNITIQATVTDDVAGIDTVKVSIGNTNNLTSPTIYNMTNTAGNTYQYVFNNTWKVGQYYYIITAQDKAENSNSTSTYKFDITSYANLTICTIYDDYTHDQYVNITDPPVGDGSTQKVWYEFLDNNSVLRIWNKYDSYYFNTSSGIQLTNHYDEYWSTNVLMLGYYNNDEWNLIYRTDELSGFNKNIETDNKTYVNITLWKNLTYNDYDFRLAIRYHLGRDDKDLTIIPYIKAYEDIPYILGFAWEIKDIQIDMTEENDFIEINNTMYYLNTTLDETYTDLDDSVFYIRENMSDTNSKSLYLKWDNNLSYKIQVKSRGGQYNAPVALAIRIGTLVENQSKYTTLFWHDASEVTYYFNGKDKSIVWSSNPDKMVDGNTSNFASTTAYDTQKCDSNTCDGTDLGDISKVELRCHGYYWGIQTDTTLYGIYGGETSEEDPNVYVTTSSAAWSSWYDITDDTLAPDPWTWEDIKGLGVLVEAENIVSMHTLYSSKVEVRVTYTPNSGPDANNPNPPSGTMGISMPYTLLNITVTDVDNDTMNVTWYTNKSGSWQSFATNNSVANNTVIQQNFTNLTENGKWWYWKVNVTDGTNYSESPVYSFYTGYQSKIENTGSTDIKGYLLMQVHYYNTTAESWVVDDDTINESTIRTISDGSELGLDTIFNGEVYTGDVVSGDLSYGYGKYRVYAVFRDPYGNILETSYGNKLEGWYEFNFSKP